MTVEILTTQFIAKPEDLDRAYAVYEKRIAQAVYGQLDSPLRWQLYELDALVEFDKRKSMMMSCARSSSSKISVNQRRFEAH